ncbi:MAG: hypothetical protein IPK07_16100 [Deltaproteobacteria bacterium]|jgi:hypothetical protein|nr:hypothetical protein [Deltaproteobacteria bacterium]
MLGLVAIAVLVAAGTAPAAPPAAAPTPAPNPYGVMVGGSGLTLKSRLEVARKLGVAFVRPWDLTLSEWGGFHKDIEAFQAEGFGIVITIRNTGDRGGPDTSPSKPPLDLANYQRRLGEVLDKYQPSLIAIEDEESSATRFAGTPEQYAAMLAAACETAHTRGVRCTNGGIPAKVLALLVTEHYRAQDKDDLADDFFDRALSESERGAIRGPGGKEKTARAIDKGKQYLAGYSKARADYVNVHWDEPDASALEEAIAYVRAATGLPVVTNALATSSSDDDDVAALLAATRKAGMSLVVWASVDRGDRRALQNPDGALRSTGRAFARFVREGK